jgi:hypothetical protein
MPLDELEDEELMELSTSPHSNVKYEKIPHSTLIATKLRKGLTALATEKPQYRQMHASDMLLP